MGPLRWLKGRLSDLLELLGWSLRRHGPAPRLLKRHTVRRYARRNRLRVFVETGTFEGEMVNAVRRTFGRIVSIELSSELHERAQSRFRNDPRITILHGDSSKVLQEITRQISSPCLYWLDAHYSGGETAHGKDETPILAELSSILERGNPQDVILIDDARLFTGGVYPTLETLTEIARGSHLPRCEVRNDIIHISR